MDGRAGGAAAGSGAPGRRRPGGGGRPARRGRLSAGHAMQAYDYRVFRGEPVDLRTLEGIVRGALGLDGRDVVQLGVVLLLATPIARVALSAFAFARQRDVTYVLVTSVVLLLLLASLLAG